MYFSLEITEEAKHIFDKLAKKNRKQLEIINKKITQILLNPYHFKPLKGLLD